MVVTPQGIPRLFVLVWMVIFYTLPFWDPWYFRWASGRYLPRERGRRVGLWFSAGVRRTLIDILSARLQARLYCTLKPKT